MGFIAKNILLFLFLHFNPACTKCMFNIAACPIHSSREIDIFRSLGSTSLFVTMPVRPLHRMRFILEGTVPTSKEKNMADNEHGSSTQENPPKRKKSCYDPVLLSFFDFEITAFTLFSFFFNLLRVFPPFDSFPLFFGFFPL